MRFMAMGFPMMPTPMKPIFMFSPDSLYMSNPAASYGASNPQKTSSYCTPRSGELDPERLKPQWPYLKIEYTDTVPVKFFTDFDPNIDTVCAA
jgi:hypothetical protein